MADIKTTLNDQRDNPFQISPGFWVGRVTRPVPLLESDPVYVVIPDIDPNIRWGPCRWTLNPGIIQKDVLDVQQRNSDFTVNSLTEITAQTVFSSAPLTFDGVTPVLVEFWAAATVNQNLGKQLRWSPQDNGVSFGIAGWTTGPGSGADMTGFYFPFRFIPSAGTHVISTSVWINSAGYIIRAGSGGAGQYTPMVQRIVSEIVSRSSFPVLGDDALVVFDNRGNPWVVSYGS